MYFFLKKTLPYALIFANCIASYFLGKSVEEKQIVDKEIVYTSSTASEVYMVWGTLSETLPPQNLWPLSSEQKDGVIYTKLAQVDGRFITRLKLPVGTDLYYWMVHKKDKNGNAVDFWDTGGKDKEFFKLVVTNDSYFKPGYFIFLAGFLPLLIMFLRKRKKEATISNIEIFRIKEYIPQFDSVRAIAVILVIFHHWLPEKSFLNFLPNGPLGVNIFFVLSGFLITGILLKARKKIEEGVSKSSVFKNFYIRRTLRIFPIYYLLLFILLVLNDPALQKDGIYYFTYASNYLFYKGQFFPGRVSHLWSLGVEEQFYLIWPWLIILPGRKLLPYIITLFIVVGISSNYIFINKGWWVEILTPACFDAFAIGALLSYLVAYRQDIIKAVQPKYPFIFCIAVILLLLDAFEYRLLPARTSHSIFAVTIIYYCLFKNNNTLANWVLNNNWLMKIGKISYGVYLYHLFIPELWGNINQKLLSYKIDFLYNNSIPEAFRPTWLFIQHFAFLMLICFISWKLIEKPINSLKKRFEYKTQEDIIQSGSDRQGAKVSLQNLV